MIVYWLAVFVAIFSWSFALLYTLQSAAMFASLYSKQGHVTHVRLSGFMARSFWTALLVFFGLVLLHLAEQYHS